MTGITAVASNIKNNKLNEKFLTEDKSAKSKSFFLKDSSTVVRNKFIDFLERNTENKKDLRICLHKIEKAIIRYGYFTTKK